ncbi:hypothetical protein [Bordetella genomosp. 13]|uniref:hypothetical protein n=1 Tax=Bordetella genomosp. 13 TaxID=463040 RepID=UPI0011A73D49|nr:hypothetical protein [Bordetella genomosp. 13]
MRRHAVRALGALLLSSLPALAWAACEPLDAPLDRSAQSEGLHAQALGLELPAHDTRVLLGPKGERVLAGPAPIVLADDDLVPRTWIDAVDWSVYGVADPRRALTFLQRDADGRLCRVDRLRATRGGAVDEGGFRLAYDAQGRITGYAEYDGPRDGGKLRSQACLTRDAQGGVLAARAECGASGPGIATPGAAASDVSTPDVSTPDAAAPGAAAPAAGVYYVRDAQGKLLRTVDLRAGPEGAVVRRLGTDGKVDAVYRLMPDSAHPDTMLAYAVPRNDRDRVLVVAAGTSPVVPTGIPDEAWQVVRVPADTLVDDGMYSWDPAVQTVLLQGRSTPNGNVVLGADQAHAFHRALLETPGRVFLYYSPMSRVLPVSALDAQTWRRCIDPTQADPKACG